MIFKYYKNQDHSHLGAPNLPHFFLLKLFEPLFFSEGGKLPGPTLEQVFDECYGLRASVQTSMLYLVLFEIPKKFTKFDNYFDDATMHTRRLEPAVTCSPISHLSKPQTMRRRTKNV
jgi:hypothetical protein